VTNAVVGAATNPHETLGPSSRKTPIVISEIMYKSAPRTDSDNLEFLELYNSNPWFQDISGYQLTGVNMTYTFPPGTILAGGAYLVVAASPHSMQSVYGITNVMGPYAGTLKHVDSLQLSDARGGILLTVPYSSVRPWPVAADGTGHSIVLANPTYGEGDPRAWDISDVVGGSPGLDHDECFQLLAPDIRARVRNWPCPRPAWPNHGSRPPYDQESLQLRTYSTAHRREDSPPGAELADQPSRVQPARYLRLSNSLASGQSVTFPAAPSYLIFLPTR
jgi:hypothetical protein